MKTKTILRIKGLKVCCSKGIEILKGLSIQINQGETHAIIGPNGSGKSTFAKALVGDPSYFVREGSIVFKNKNLISLSTEQRAKLGLFLAFQSPREIPGLTNFDLLLFSHNEKQKFYKKKEKSPLEFVTYISPFCERLGINSSFLSRGLNENFSGGEKKKNELLQMFALNPDLVLLDELDSGLDVDALQIMSKSLNVFKASQMSKSIVIITHNFKIFDHIHPDFVHLMQGGKIIKTGDISLAKIVEEKGYNYFTRA